MLLSMKRGGLTMPDVKRTAEIRDVRRTFVGGSDARIITGTDEARLLRLWREKRGEAAPEDLSSNLIVQLGSIPLIKSAMSLA